MIIEVKDCRYGKMMYFPNDMYIGKSLQQYGEYSQHEMNLFDTFLKPGMNVMDVGANIGTHTVYFAKKVGPEGKVFAFEPQQQIFHMMVGNLALNELTNVEVFWAGVGKELGAAQITLCDWSANGNFGETSLNKHYSDEYVKVPVQVLTIDSLNIEDEIHFIKMDVEGMEYEALQGAMQTIKNYNPVMYIEWSRASAEGVIDTLFGLDYRLYWHTSLGYYKDNFFGNKIDLWENCGTQNMLCVPPYLKWKIELPEIVQPWDVNPEMITSENAVFHS